MTLTLTFSIFWSASVAILTRRVKVTSCLFWRLFSHCARLCLERPSRNTHENKCNMDISKVGLAGQCSFCGALQELRQKKWTEHILRESFQQRMETCYPGKCGEERAKENFSQCCGMDSKTDRYSEERRTPWIVRAARQQNETAPATNWNRSEKWFEKREQRSEKNDPKRAQKILKPSSDT